MKAYQYGVLPSPVSPKELAPIIVDPAQTVSKVMSEIEGYEVI